MSRDRLARLCRRTAFLLPLPLCSCTSLRSGFLLDPAGPIAQAERHEFMIMGIILAFVWVPVFLLVPAFAWYYRITNSKAVFRPQWGFNWYLEGLIWLPPLGVVFALAYFLISYTLELDPYRPLKQAGPALEVQVVALDWKWLFVYPAQHIASVNELILPAGQPVHLQITSGTVMQSILMPQLAGQIYAMDGMRTQLNFAAGRPGTYYGENTQYNGDGFANDKFVIHAVPPSDFAKWAAQMAAGSAVLDDRAYQALSVQSVLPHPQQFGHVPPDLFDRILAQKIQPGYLTQHHENGGNG